MRLRKRTDAPVDPDGTATCPLCKDTVVVQPDGHCWLGHRVTSPEMVAASGSAMPAPGAAATPGVPDLGGGVPGPSTGPSAGGFAPPAAPAGGFAPAPAQTLTGAQAPTGAAAPGATARAPAAPPSGPRMHDRAPAPAPAGPPTHEPAPAPAGPRMHEPAPAPAPAGPRMHEPAPAPAPAGPRMHESSEDVQPLPRRQPASHGGAADDPFGSSSLGDGDQDFDQLLDFDGIGARSA